MINVRYGKYDITEIVTNVEWSGHSEKPNRQLNVSLKNTLDGETQVIKIEKGGLVEFRNNKVLLFRGIVFATDINELGDMSITAYDENIYLTKSTDNRKFTKMKASEIASRICKDYGLLIGGISDTGYVIPKLIMRDKSLHDILLYALTLTKKQTGKRFFIWNRGGKFYLRAATENPSKYLIERGRNIISASYSETIEDTITQVKVIGGKKDQHVVKLKNATLAKKYGVMQAVEQMDEKATKSQVEQRARTLLKERGVIDDQATVEVLGIDDVITGSAVYVKESMTGIVGGYYVTSDSHTYSNGVHTMTLELSKTYDLPKIEIEKEALGK
ncbi:XkdQ/YqbQ family protein [Neobacillus mesonae]|uniref:YqbQ/XkdQ domain-containing protein n=1 Tax=Neobacillus mesonae TaxID=1193713 RepID=A0A3Q9QXL3_9BACI|nr:hypothetical protein [Neobacillus mesonae]AZU61080.1 hypothetical protein CHR53_07330 [Neobacillus mesonae]